MAFTVETGAGLAAANAYVSVADADAYFADRGDPTAWSGATDPAKQAAIVKATDYIEKRFGHRFVGTKGSSTQALSWPRDNAYDRDGFLLADDEVPTKVANATAEYALRAIAATLMPDPTINVDTAGQIVRKHEKVGPIERELEYQGSGGDLPAYPHADLMLRGMLIPGGRAIRA